MKSLVFGIMIGVAAGIATTAAAVGFGRDVYLNAGDHAIAAGGATSCDVARHGGSRPGFRCYVGGDYRAPYGVIVNECEAAITRYTGFSHYRVIYRRSNCRR
jgi:hypothetical protein